MGSVFRRGQAWYIRYDLPPGPDGKRRARMVSCRGMTRRQAEAELARIQTEIHGRRHIEESRLTLSEYLDRYIRDCASREQSPAAAETTARFLRLYIRPRLGHFLLSHLDPLHIQACYNELSDRGGIHAQPLAPKTIRNAAGALHRALDQAVRWRLIPINPADKLSLPHRNPSTRRAADLHETASLIEALAHSSYRLPILVALYTGMRRGEIVGLRWEDFDADVNLLRVARSIGHTTALGPFVKEPKTAAGVRALLIPPELVRELQTHRKGQIERASQSSEVFVDHGWIFPDPAGELMSPGRLGKAFGRLARAANIQLSLHELRHTQATILFANGIQDKLVSERLGHASVTITKDLYTHLIADLQRPAVDAVVNFIAAARKLANSGQ